MSAQKRFIDISKIDKHYFADMMARLIPVPKSVSIEDGAMYRICDRCKVVLTTKETEGAEKMVSALFRQYWNVLPEIVLKNKTDNSRRCCSEAYSVRVSEKQLTITAEGKAGLMNALKTLRQLAEAERTKRLENLLLVPCKIDDQPTMEFRGIHLCIFPETPLWDLEKKIRLAAYHKFNYAVIEAWGVFPFRSHPEFCWSDRKIDRRKFKRLIRLGKELGITLIPQLNLLGHASNARFVTGKHAILDCHPELLPIFEPDGWCWCISNTETRKVLTDLVMELHDFFETPPYFHIGCDEAHSLATCYSCRKFVLKDLITDHILWFHDLLKKRGARAIMWHDMLLEKNDKRWKNYIAHGKIANLHKAFPRDIIIADWQYDRPRPELDSEPDWATVKFFKKQGFDVLMCPWLDPRDMRSIGKTVGSEHLMGMLETTWHKSDHVFEIFADAAEAAWNPLQPISASYLSLAEHVRHICWDMKICDYEQTGWFRKQINDGELYQS